MRPPAVPVVSARPPAFPVADLGGLTWWREGRPPPASAVAAVRQSLSLASVWRVSNHGVPAEQLDALREAGRAFFDQPSAQKWPLAVGHMDRSRGWELYPQHKRYHLAALSRGAAPGHHAEPSAAEGILCERFVCGPPRVCNEPLARAPHPFYDSDWGRVFYERNSWPSDGGTLRPAMEAAYASLEPVAMASLQCVAAAIGLPYGAFGRLVETDSAEHPAAPLRHHSRLQLNNYPSQQRSVATGRQTPPIRASRHLDTSLLTVLARQATDAARPVPGESGALEVRMADGSWACVPAAEGELTVFLGSLAAVLSGFELSPTTHRVSNPPASHAASSRRMSISYVLKPDYTVPAAPAAVVPHLEREYAAVAEELPMVGHVGRAGWQNHAMQRGIAGSRLEAVSTFKPWKIETFGRLRAACASERARRGARG